MKIKYITLIAVLLFSLYVPAQAQSDEGSVWDGIEGTLNNMFDDPIQRTEAGRLFMLFSSDISFIMKAHNDEEFKRISQGPISLYTSSEASDASIYGEFDWDNRALSMHFKESATNQTMGIAMSETVLPLTKKSNKTPDHYQFTDKDGYWYVPNDSGYVKFNAKKAVTGFSGLGLESLEAEMASAFGAESFRNEIRNLLNDRYLSIAGFPVFIHWAFLYSPDYVRARYNVTEQTIHYSENASLTKLTVASGTEKGKFLLFDQYNRLIYIDSKKEGSIEFFYGRDLTVTLPPARTMSDVINDAIKSSKK